MSQANDIKGKGQRIAGNTLREEGVNNVNECNNELFMSDHLIQAVERSWSGPWGHSHIHVTACIG